MHRSGSLRRAAGPPGIYANIATPVKLYAVALTASRYPVDRPSATCALMPARRRADRATTTAIVVLLARMRPAIRRSTNSTHARARRSAPVTLPASMRLCEETCCSTHLGVSGPEGRRAAVSGRRGHLPSAIGDWGSNRKRASSGLVPSARTISVQPWPLARASWTRWGNHLSACSMRLAISAMLARSSPSQTPRRSASAATASSMRVVGVLAAARIRSDHRFTARAAGSTTLMSRYRKQARRCHGCLTSKPVKCVSKLPSHFSDIAVMLCGVPTGLVSPQLWTNVWYP